MLANSERSWTLKDSVGVWLAVFEPTRRTNCLLTKLYLCKKVRNMDRDMRLRKVCPQCNMVVHVKRSCCGCGHVFTLKRKARGSADKSMGKAVKRRRALQTVEDTLRRQEQNRTRMASMRASESQEHSHR